MKRKTLVSVLAIFLALCFVASGFAMEKGNKRKGKYTYRKVYKSCYQRGEVNSLKPPVNPDSKTQAQWEQLFDNRQFGEFGCKEEWAKLSDKDITDIYTYLHSFAADSPTPAKCK